MVKKEEIQSMAFMIISYAGSSFDHFYKSIECARTGDFDSAEREMTLGKEDLKKAHESQTDMLSAETKNEDIPFSIIMTHAQDHLTMAILTERMAKEFVCLYRERGEDRKNG
ncbi:PTS system cellobiose-specific IIA component/PTS system lactose-specific IIA component [Clostridium sp. KNHs216]|nr:PTS system cellobiose-specific IIA component/PTS system lactose-specific IIA component [Clostridium sp. KNHs216]